MKKLYMVFVSERRCFAMYTWHLGICPWPSSENGWLWDNTCMKELHDDVMFMHYLIIVHPSVAIIHGCIYYYTFIAFHACTLAIEGPWFFFFIVIMETYLYRKMASFPCTLKVQECRFLFRILALTYHRRMMDDRKRLCMVGIAWSIFTFNYLSYDRWMIHATHRIMRCVV